MSITKNKVLLSIFILSVYLLCSYGWDIKAYFLPDLFSDDRYLRNSSVQLTFFLIIPVLVTAALYGWKNLPQELGLNRGFGKGLGFALLATLPMAVGYAVVSGFNWSMNLPEFMYGCVQAGFTEEIIFRAFLFGLLYRKAGWGLVPATLFDGLVFGAIHVYQGDTMLEAAMVFVATGAGAVWFSWLFKEWNWNLWVPIFLHFFMNFWWGGFDMAENAAGGIWANVFRVMTIAFTVIVTTRPAIKARFTGKLAVQ
ncbi:CPBP family intramembrane glutamic endopeptidase [Neolewinella persica]|uniref:CPBP family intramembrane glutamic endopeptidase n=1 Tax=Neolewinella persica TaxID=70998 RepID=UPI00036D6B7C|nr:CPBP family intramembrane glutamic endopeptidase [Neolewinella persica]